VIRENAPYDVSLLELAKALVEFQQGPLAQRPERFKAIRRKLAPHFSTLALLGGEKDIRRTFRRSGRAFVQSGAGSLARLWFAWKLNWQWSLLLVAPLFFSSVIRSTAILAVAIAAIVHGRSLSRKT
jgi:hypothetical protein